MQAPEGSPARRDDWLPPSPRRAPNGYLSATISFRLAASPATPWMSEGMMIFVA